MNKWTTYYIIKGHENHTPKEFYEEWGLPMLWARHSFTIKAVKKQLKFRKIDPDEYIENGKFNIHNAVNDMCWGGTAELAVNEYGYKNDKGGWWIHAHRPPGLIAPAITTDMLKNKISKGKTK